VKSRPLLSRILAALGALLLLSAPATLLFFSGLDESGRLGAVGWAAAAKLALGAGAMVLAVLVGSPGGARRFFAGRAAHFGFFTVISAAMVAAILAVANWVAHARPVSWDLTRNRIFTLAPDTLETLGRLDGDVRALAFYLAAEPEHAAAESLFRRYAAVSGRFRWEMVDPYRSPELVKQHGITDRSPRIVLLAGGREARVREPTEEALTTGLVALSAPRGRKVYFLTGHGEPGLDQGYGVAAKELRDDGFEVATLSLLEAAEVPADATVVLAAGARKALLDPEVKALRAWLEAGGKLGVYLEPGLDTGLDGLLRDWGIEAPDDLVVDPSPVSALFGGSASTPLVTPTTQHPVTRALEGVGLAFPTARSLTGLSAATVPPFPLVLTARSAWAERDVSGAFAGRTVRQDSGEKPGPFPVAMAAARSVPGGEAGREGRLLVAGDSEFFDDGYQQVLGNLDFFLNGVAWLAEQPDRITVRPRAREGSRLFLTEAQVSVLRFLTVDAVPLALLGLGLAIWLVRRSR
jgi:ABC-type uncharacterized transport system involved in gliding motility auxiliary subunit